MTRLLRSAVLPISWLTALIASVVLLLELGDGVLSTPPITDLDEAHAWLDGQEAVTAFFALLRIVALGIAGYLVVITVLGLIARATRRASLVRLTDLGTVPAVRHLLGTMAGVGLTASAATLAIGTGASAGDGGSVGTEQPRPDDPLVIERLPDGSSMDIERLETDDGDGTATMRVLPAEAPPPKTDDPPAWVVVPGDTMWVQAERVLDSAWGRPAIDAEIVPYWDALIEANRTRLADPSNPDLIFAGQTFELPPAPPAP